jgi:hypothetical protein
MDASRTVTALVGVVVSLAISAAIYVVTGSMLLFVVVPLVPFLFTRLHGGETEGSDRASSRECPACGFRARSPDFEYCPRDGRRLQEPTRRRP